MITGMSNGDYGVRGRIVALDAKTGKRGLEFYSCPRRARKATRPGPRTTTSETRRRRFMDTADRSRPWVFVHSAPAIRCRNGPESCAAATISIPTGWWRSI